MSSSLQTLQQHAKTNAAPCTILLFECCLKETVHSCPVSSAYLVCRRLNDPIFSQRSEEKHWWRKKTDFLFIYSDYLSKDCNYRHLFFLTAPTGDSDDEKRSRKQGEVKGQGLGRGKARKDAGPFPPGVLFGKEVEVWVGVGRGFEWKGLFGNLRAIFLHRENGLCFCCSSLSRHHVILVHFLVLKIEKVPVK